MWRRQSQSQMRGWVPKNRVAKVGLGGHEEMISQEPTTCLARVSRVLTAANASTLSVREWQGAGGLRPDEHERLRNGRAHWGWPRLRQGARYVGAPRRQTSRLQRGGRRSEPLIRIICTLAHRAKQSYCSYRGLPTNCHAGCCTSPAHRIASPDPERTFLLSVGACPAGAGPSPKEDPSNPWPGLCGTGKVR